MSESAKADEGASRAAREWDEHAPYVASGLLAALGFALFARLLGPFDSLSPLGEEALTFASILFGVILWMSGGLAIWRGIRQVLRA